MKHILGVFILVFSFLQCQTSQKIAAIVPLNERQQINFLDSATAAAAIILDTTDHLFEKIQPLDMSIQLKMPLKMPVNRSSILSQYQLFLRKDVSSFTKTEQQYVQKAFLEASNLVSQISTQILPKEIKLIKTKANHYGKSVYYTRENCIIIPNNVLETQDYDEFMSTMMHEIFHIYSRFNPEKRKKLYALIGFKNLLQKDLTIEDSLRQRILLNPDGVDFAQFIDIQACKSCKKISAVPIIFANEFNYRTEKPDFFNYLTFNIFQIEKQGKHAFQVYSKRNGDPLLNVAQMPSFNEQIGDNTGYIIHPDEILADNFMLLCLKNKTPDRIDKLSQNGKELLEKIRLIIQS